LMKEAKLGNYTAKMENEFNDASELYSIENLTVGQIGEKYGMTVDDAARLEGFIAQAKQRTQYLVMEPRTGEVMQDADGNTLAVTQGQLREIEDRGLLAPVLRWRAPEPDKYSENNGCGPGRLLLRDGTCARQLTQDVLLSLCGAEEEWKPGDALTEMLDSEEIVRIKQSCKAYQDANQLIQKKRPRFEQILYDAVMSFYTFNPTAVPGYVMDKVARIAGYALKDIDPDGKLRMKAKEVYASAKTLVVPYTEQAGNWLSERAKAGAKALNEYSGGWAGSAYNVTGKAAALAGSAAYVAKDKALAAGRLAARAASAAGSRLLAEFIRSSPGMKQFAWSMVEMLKHAYCTGFYKLFVTGMDSNGQAAVDESSTMWNTFFAFQPEQVADVLQVGLSVVPVVGPLAGPIAKLGARVLQTNSVKNLGKRFWLDLFESCDDLKARSGELTKEAVGTYFRTGVKAAIAVEGDSKTMGLLQLGTDALSSWTSGGQAEDESKSG
jgi:hypothetical protein